MKKSTKLFFKTVIISAWCCSVFIGAGYYYLNKNFSQAEIKTESIPYTQESPENAGILFNLSGEETFVYLDFENEKITVSLIPEKPIDNEIYGYSLDYKVTANTDLVALMVDYIGGLELTYTRETLRYTGIQIADLIESTTSLEIRREIIKSVCKKISTQNVGVDFFADIIKNSDTDLKLPECYFWADEMNILCANLQFID